MINVSHDTTHQFTSKPSRHINFNTINNSLANNWIETTIPEFATTIASGYSWSGGKFDGARKAGKWQGQQLFGIDVDSVGAPTPNEAIAKLSDVKLSPSVVYNSFSSTVTNNKYRAVLVASEIIVDPPLALAILRGAVRLLDADAACVDLARFFYGTTPDKIVLIDDQTIPTQALIEFAAKYGKPHNQSKSYTETTANEKALEELTDSERVLLKHQLHQFRLKLRRLDGVSRYNTLWQASNTLALKLKQQLPPLEDFLCLTLHRLEFEAKENKHWASWDKLADAENIVTTALKLL